MAKKGLVFTMNEYPKKNDVFFVRHIYRFIPDFKVKHSITSVIELEIYEPNLCIISFYDKNHKQSENRYKLRTRIGAGHIKAILKACFQAFYSLDGDYALLFSAADDVGKIEEFNARYSAYKLFIENNFRNYNEYVLQGAEGINTLMLYHQSFQHKKEADKFYEKFNKKTSADLYNNEDLNLI